MKHINLNKIGDNLEELFDIKRDIENVLIKNKEITSKLSLEDFFTKLFSHTIVFIKGSNVVSFVIIKGKTDSYFIYTSDNEDIVELAINKLNKVKFNINNLQHLTVSDLMSENLETGEYFINNGQYLK